MFAPRWPLVGVCSVSMGGRRCFGRERGGGGRRCVCVSRAPADPSETTVTPLGVERLGYPATLAHFVPARRLLLFVVELATLSCPVAKVPPVPALCVCVRLCLCLCFVDIPFVAWRFLVRWRCRRLGTTVAPIHTPVRARALDFYSALGFQPPSVVDIYCISTWCNLGVLYVASMDTSRSDTWLEYNNACFDRQLGRVDRCPHRQALRVSWLALRSTSFDAKLPRACGVLLLFSR